MKRWSLPKNKKILIATISILLIGTIFILIEISRSTNINSSNVNSSICPSMPEETSNLKSLRFHPIKVVVEPWRGEDNVYAIFAIPLQYKDIHYHLEMRVKDTDIPWQITIADERWLGSQVPKDHFLLISFVRTSVSVTLWYLLTGKFSDLQQPCNWTLYFYPQAK